MYYTYSLIPTTTNTTAHLRRAVLPHALVGLEGREELGGAALEALEPGPARDAQRLPQLVASGQVAPLPAHEGDVAQLS